MNNFEKIKTLNLDEMAELFNRKFCEECAYKEMNFDDWRDCDVICWAHIQNHYYKNWLLEEYQDE